MKKIILLLSIFSLGQLLQAQETVPTSGGEAVGDRGTVSFSIGQIVYTPNSNAAGKSQQGVQQGIELFSKNNIQLNALAFKAVTYPNPTKNFVTLSIKEKDLGNLSYSLYDLFGKHLSSGNINKTDTKISLTNYQAGSYLLKVKQHNVELRSFKIIKH